MQSEIQSSLMDGRLSMPSSPTEKKSKNLENVSEHLNVTCRSQRLWWIHWSWNIYEDDRKDNSLHIFWVSGIPYELCARPNLKIWKSLRFQNNLFTQLRSLLNTRMIGHRQSDRRSKHCSAINELRANI